jgi:hypothetical protein
VAQASEEEGAAEREEAVADDGAGDRCFHEVEHAGPQRRDGDDELSHVAEGRVEKAADRVARPRRDVLGRLAEQARERHDGQDRQHEEQRVRLRLRVLGHDRDRHEDEEPVEAIAAKVLDDRVHAIPPGSRS